MPARRIATAILFSGRGSNMRALIEAAQAADYPADITCCLTDNPHAPGIAHARDYGIVCETFDTAQYNDKSEFEAALHTWLHDHGIALICLAGFMRILGPDFVAAWPGRIINIHPSLLPAYKGLNTHARVLANGDTETGCSVHYVDAGIDTGEIIGQRRVPIYAQDDAARLEARVRAAEHALYPAMLAHVAHQLLQHDNDPA